MRRCPRPGSGSNWRATRSGHIRSITCRRRSRISWSCMAIGHQKGRDTKENVLRRFGMARPEGYRKALRLMRHAEKFGAPVITLIDIPGADPSLVAEERGQAFAIAENLQ